MKQSFASAARLRGGGRARFGKSGISYGELIDDRSKWEARLRSWRQSRFWLPLWGPKPTEPGCFAPREVLQGIQQGG